METVEEAARKAEDAGRKAAEKPLDQITLADADVIECPYQTYTKLREEAPVFKDPIIGFYVVSRYVDIQEIIKDTETFSSSIAEALIGAEQSLRAEDFGGYANVDTLITVDPPKHKYYRNPINKVFSLARVNEMHDYIQQIVDELIDGFIDDGECEFVTQFTIPLPMSIIADQIGVPRSDLDLFKGFSDALTTQVSMIADREQRIWAAKKSVEFQKYFAKVIEEKRANPTDDIISDLVRARMEDGEPMSTPELLSILNQLLVAGNETTTNSLSTGLMLLCQHPDQMKLVSEDLSLVEKLTEEVLRFDGPVQGLMRVATRDAEIAGTAIPKGAVVMLRYASGNRDERQYDDGETFDITREVRGAHLAFGQGVHFCLGAMLARAEMNIAFRTLLKRLRNIRIVDDKGPLEHHPNVVLRGLKELHIAFDKT